MKLFTYRTNSDSINKLGILSPNGQAFYPLHQFGYDYSDVVSFIRESNDSTVLQLTGKINEYRMSNRLEEITRYDTIACAPIPNPAQDIICLGINYIEHAKESAKFKKEEFGGEREYPIYFSKRVDRALVDGENIQSHTDIVDSLDYECELAVIIGKDAYNICEEEANDYIFGYTILNDVSARNLQTRHKQWYLGKSLDGFTPIGPCIATKDEFEYPPKLSIRSYVNGELRQDSNTELLLTGISRIISELSQGMTLKAGTVISTGTPNGVGMGFVPPKWLQAGDEVICEIEGIGRITNHVK